MERMKSFDGYKPVILALLIALTLFLPQNLSGQKEKRLIREGNRLYQKEQFDDSELSYRRALERDVESPQARFNLGNALYRQNKYDEAVRHFRELADEIDDSADKSKVYHNLGNSLLMDGNIGESIEAYKNALRNNPADDETRYNLAFAQHLLDETENQQEGDNGEGGQDQQDEDEEDGGQDSRQEQDDRNGESNPDQEERAEQPEQQDPQQISPEDAMRMLEAAEREERRVQEKLMEEKASEQRPRTGRNW